MPQTSPVGPSDETRRSLDVPLRWHGLSRSDRDVLGSFLSTIDVKPNELHTGIPLGDPGVAVAAAGSAGMRRMAEHVYALRGDAALRFGDEWWLVELKTWGNHHAIGQLLCYWFCWCRDCPECRLRRCLLVCLAADPAVLALAEVLGIDVLVVQMSGASELVRAAVGSAQLVPP